MNTNTTSGTGSSKELNDIALELLCEEVIQKNPELWQEFCHDGGGDDLITEVMNHDYCRESFSKVLWVLQGLRDEGYHP